MEMLSEHHPKVSFCLSRKGKRTDGYHSQAATDRYGNINSTIENIIFIVSKPFKKQ
jgi:hypothetical protein